MATLAAPQRPPRQPLWMAGFLLLLACLFLTFGAGLGGPFLFDDYPNLLGSAAMRAWSEHRGSLAAVLHGAGAGPLGRPLAVTTLALQLQWFGPHPWPFKCFNLLVHALSAWVVWRLADVLFALADNVAAGPGGSVTPPVATVSLRDGRRARARWAFAAALLWAVHPLTLTTVLYVVQRMTGLATLFMLLALWRIVTIRQRLGAGQAVSWLAWAVVPLCGTLALAAKESGILLVLYVLVLDQTVLRAQVLPATAARQWRRGMWLLVYLPVLLALLSLPWLLPRLVAGFADREFTLGQRLFTEARIVWLYLRLLVLPDPSAFGLYHDDVVLSQGWWQPASTAGAVLALAATSVFAWWARRRSPWWGLAWGFVLASQMLESTVVPLELMHEHRMYLGMLGPILALVAVVRARLAEMPGRPLSVRLVSAPLIRLRRGLVGHPWAALVLLPLILAAGLATAGRAAAWRNPLGMMQLEVLHHPASVHATYDLAVLYGELAESSHDAAERQRLFALAIAWAGRAQAIDPRLEKTLAGYILVCSEGGCVPPPDAFARLQGLLRTGPRADLMVADVLALMNCQADRSCHFAAADLLGCIDALHANPRVSPAAWAMLGNAEVVLREVVSRGGAVTAAPTARPAVAGGGR